MNISYSPLTRVDVRRMYKVGVLDREGVKRSYKDLGYSEINAERLTEFTVRYEGNDELDEQSNLKKLSQATILKAYKNNIIDATDALLRLVQLGYDRDDASLLIQISDFDKSVGIVESVDDDFANRGIKLVKDAYLRKVYSESEATNAFIALGYTPTQATLEVQFLSQEYDRKLKDKAIDIVRTAYMERTFDRNFTIAMLNAFSVDGREQQELLAELDAFKDLRADKLPYSQLRSLFRQGFITEFEFLEELRGLGYAEKYVIWLARSEGIKI